MEGVGEVADCTVGAKLSKASVNSHSEAMELAIS